MNVQGVIKTYAKDKWTWFLIPNIVLFSVFLLNLFISMVIPSDEKFYTGGVSYLFVYMFVMGIIVVAQTFPYLIGMSVRRTDYFTGTVIMGVMTNVFFAILLLVFSILENSTNGWGGRFHFFHFPYLNDGTILEQLLVYIIVFIHLFFLGFLISSFFKRFGGKGLLIAALITVLITSIGLVFIHYKGAWMDVFHWFANHTAAEISYWLIIPTIIYIGFSYTLLRKSTL